jgi:DNA-binding NtrC family response regulator
MSDDGKPSAIERLRQRKSARQAQAGVEGPNHTIFLVDDEAPNLDALARVLGDRYHVTRFESAMDALSVIAADKCPGLIITDELNDLGSQFDLSSRLDNMTASLELLAS